MQNSSTRNAPRSSSEGQYVETTKSHGGMAHKIEWILFTVFSMTLSVSSMAYVLENKLHPLLLKTGILRVEEKERTVLRGYAGGRLDLRVRVPKKLPATVAKKAPPPKPKRTDKPNTAKHHPDDHLIPWIDAAEMQQR